MLEEKLRFRRCDFHARQPPEVNDTYYCASFAKKVLSGSCVGSSLVDYAYRSALQSRLVFTVTDMPLIWEPVDFWKKYYAKMNQTLPHYNGSNPTMLLQSVTRFLARAPWQLRRGFTT